MDVLSSSAIDDKIAWYENDGAADPSFTARTIATSADGAYSVYAADIDNDGDMDVLSASVLDEKIAWYENDGAADPSFTARTIATSVDDAVSVYAADIDNDGDLDVLCRVQKVMIRSPGTKTMARQIPVLPLAPSLRPLITRGGSTPQILITMAIWTCCPLPSTIKDNLVRKRWRGRSQFYRSHHYYLRYSARSVYAADIDNDGDMDVLSASYSDDKIAWYENDGAADPSFTARTINYLR